MMNGGTEVSSELRKISVFESVRYACGMSVSEVCVCMSGGDVCGGECVRGVCVNTVKTISLHLKRSVVRTGGPRFLFLLSSNADLEWICGRVKQKGKIDLRKYWFIDWNLLKFLLFNLILSGSGCDRVRSNIEYI